MPNIGAKKTSNANLVLVPRKLIHMRSVRERFLGREGLFFGSKGVLFMVRKCGQGEGMRHPNFRAPQEILFLIGLGFDQVKTYFLIN